MLLRTKVSCIRRRVTETVFCKVIQYRQEASASGPSCVTFSFLLCSGQVGQEEIVLFQVRSTEVLCLCGSIDTIGAYLPTLPTY